MAALRPGASAPLVPYLPRQSGYNKRLRRAGELFQHVIAHLGEPTPPSVTPNERGTGTTTCWQWGARNSVSIGNRGNQFHVNVRSDCGRVQFGRTGEPTDQQVRDLCILAGLLPAAALDGAGLVA